MSVNLILFIVSSLNIIDGHQHGGYTFGDYTTDKNRDWMSYLDGNILINKLSIPGTHDTMAFYGGDITRCQTLSLSNQLNAGIRAFDIRLKLIDDELLLYHGSVYQKSNFDDVLTTIQTHFTMNNNETVIMRIKEEQQPKNRDPQFRAKFHEYWTNYADLFYQYNTTNYSNIWPIPVLNDVRGKIFVLDNFTTDIDYMNYYGIPFDSSYIQDKYKLTTNWDLYDKWEYIKLFLGYSNTQIIDDSSSFYINFISGSTGSFPYFVASGHST